MGNNMTTATDYIVENNQTQEEYQLQFPGARCLCNIYAKSNESLNLDFIWEDGNGFANDLSSYTGKMSIKERKDGHITVATCGNSEDDDGTLVTNSSGHIIINMSYTVLQSLYKSGTWVYDILLKDASGNITRLIEGYFYIDRGVTLFDNA